MLRSSSVLATAALLRSSGSRRGRYLALANVAGSSRHWSGGVHTRTTSNRPPGVVPAQPATRRPLKGWSANECTISSSNNSSRASSTWAERPEISPHQARRRQERGRRGAAWLLRRRRLSSTPWWVGGTTAPPAGTPDISNRDRQHRPQRERGARRVAGSRQRNPHHHGLDGWASEWQGRPNAAASAGGPSTPPRWRDREAGKRQRGREGASQLLNQSIIRRLASARRSKDWRAALGVLDTVEREATAAAAAAAAAAPRDGPTAATAAAAAIRRVWCTQGRTSREDAERARTTVYNIVLDVLSARRSARWQEAFSLLETMQERGVTADIYTLNSILKACSSSGQVELLLTLLKEMRSNPRGAGDSNSSNSSKRSTGVSVEPLLPAPDVVSFNIALAACARAGEATLALELLEEMRAANSEGRSTAAAAAAAAVATTTTTGRATGAGAVARLSPAPRPNLSSFNSALSACARGTDTSGGGGGGSSSSSSSRNDGVANGREREEEEGLLLQRAMELFSDMRSGAGGAPSPDMSTYKEMINACGWAGRWEQALSFVEDAVEDGLELTAPVFCAIITAFGRCGEWRRALSVVYEDMPRSEVMPDMFCYNMALRACADAGRIKEALEILDDDLYGMGKVNGFSYSSIMDALARQGESDLAMRLLREIDGVTGHKPNAWHYGAAFLACLKAGDEDGARSVQSEWRDFQAREATDRMNQAARGVSSSSQASREGAAAAAAIPPMREGVGDSPAVAPGDKFQPPDLMCMAAFHADNGAWADCLDVLDTAKEVSRTARAAVRAKANELLLGRAEMGERIGTVGATGVEGAGIASWREVAARNSDATDRDEEAARALRGCYEAAVEALGRAGRWKQALEVLGEGAAIARKSGLSLDPACFVPALQACCGGGGGDNDDEDENDGRGREGEAGLETGAALLEKVEETAGVAPDSWCANVVMEAAVRDEQWSLASAVFDQAEARHISASASASACRRGGLGCENLDHSRRRDDDDDDDDDDRDGNNAAAGDEDAGCSAAAPGAAAAAAATAATTGGAEGPLPSRSRESGAASSRGPRELRKTAIDATAPTAKTYGLALQACVGAALTEDMAERAVSLVRKMAADPHMAPTRELIALAQQVCTRSEDVAAAVKVRRLEIETQERHSNGDFSGQWIQQRRSRLERPRPRPRW